MIVFPHLKKLIITPPKCGSTTLNEFMCRPPYHGYVIVGPMGKIEHSSEKGIWFESYDHHTNIVPEGILHFERYALVRHPLQRMISMWCHFARIQTMHGLDNMDVNQYLIDIGGKKHPFYFFQWNLTQCLGLTDSVKVGVRDTKNEFVGFIRQEHMDEDLLKFGFKDREDTLVPKINVSAEIYTPLPRWEDVLRPVFVEGAKWWWEPDLKYGDYEVNLPI